MTSPRVLSVLIAVVLSLAACGTSGRSSGGTSSGASTDLAEALSGRTFLATKVTGHDLVPGSTIRLSFEAATVTANAGCNTLGGTLAVTDGRLVTGPVMSTSMACEAKLMVQDQWLAKFLEAKPQIALAGDTLTLRTPGVVTVELLDRRVVQPDRPLEGTAWTVDGLIDGLTASSVEAKVPATLRFDDGRVTVDTGCNTGSATYALSGSTLTLGPLALTRKACDPTQMALERAVVATFDQVLRVRIDADALTLSSESHGLTLRATT